MFIEWVAGVLFRPSATFEHARQHLRFGYWWIILSVFTLETVASLYMPATEPVTAVPTDVFVMFMAFYTLFIFDIHALLLRGAAWALGWKLLWSDALKYTGLSWSVILLEDIVTFYPMLKGQVAIVLWAGLPFMLWHLISLTSGVKRLTGYAVWRAALVAAVATIPWRAVIFWLNWQQL